MTEPKPDPLDEIAARAFPEADHRAARCRAALQQARDPGRAERDKKINALEAVVLGLEGLLAAYRLGSSSRADAALTKLEKARAALAALAAREKESR
jgi:hypothetical protein